VFEAQSIIHCCSRAVLNHINPNKENLGHPLPRLTNLESPEFFVPGMFGHNSLSAMSLTYPQQGLSLNNMQATPIATEKRIPEGWLCKVLSSGCGCIASCTVSRIFCSPQSFSRRLPKAGILACLHQLSSSKGCTQLGQYTWKKNSSPADSRGFLTLMLASRSEKRALYFNHTL
jgi:hypothetical protein